MLLRSPILTLALFLLPSVAPADDEQLRWDAPIVCVQKPTGETLRTQCTEEGKEPKVCLFSTACRAGTSGATCVELDRTQMCGHAPDGDRARYDQLVAAGYTFREVTAEAPPGWHRDSAGRVFQVSFDLNRRVWLGARYAPSFAEGTDPTVGRVGLELGLRADTLWDDLRTRFRVQVLPTEIFLNPLQVDSTLLLLEENKNYGDPFFRISTFWPEPRRHDLFANFGWWLQVLGTQYRPRGSEDDLMLRFLAFAPTLELWHDADLASFVRLRAGAAFDDLFQISGAESHRLAISPLAYLEADITFDDAGFHHLLASTGYEAPIWWPEDGGPVYQNRFVNEIAYEVILLAINDQPVTLRTAVSGGYRDDLVGAPNGWELTASVGLRISLWAPPRDPEALAAARERDAKE